MPFHIYLCISFSIKENEKEKEKEKKKKTKNQETAQLLWNSRQIQPELPLK